MSSKLLNYPSASSNPHLVASTGAGGAGGASSSGAAGRSGVATAGAGGGQLNFENLQLDDILCTVCQSVLVEPVFLPCQHRFCRNCLSGTIEKNNLNCPCCRKRFGTWYRNASRVNKLVHEQLWNAIQSQFRDYLEEDGAAGGGSRCNGNGTVGSCFVPPTESVIHLSEPGEIRKEYENELQRYRKELIEEKKKELVASEKYIINLYKQEGIIDLVDSSDHLSISSSTSTPEPPEKEEVEQPSAENKKKKQSAAAAAADVHEVEDDEGEDEDAEAGPSGSSFQKPSTSVGKSNGNGAGDKEKKDGTQQKSTEATVSSSNATQQQPASNRPGTSKSQSNGSVISISSTSSASAASTSCISSASSRYSLIKSQQKGQSSNATTAGVSTSSKQPAIVKKVFTMAELNKNELCVKPTKLHRRTSSQAVDDDDDDGDSLRSELNHFKPIIATTPKSCFSPKAVVRVPSVRPETSTTLPLGGAGSAECFGPTKSPFKPIDPTTPRRSAFSVVNINLFTPPTLSSLQPNASRSKKQTGSGSSSKKSSASSSAGSSSVSSKKKKQQKVQAKTAKPTPLATRRKRKLKFSPQPSQTGKVKSSPKDPKEPTEANSTAISNRITRQSLNKKGSRLKDLIVNDQQRREAMIEQERRDYEFAQKLQKKLNRTRTGQLLNQVEQTSGLAIMATVTKEVSSPARKQTGAYSLRRKTVAIFPTPQTTSAESSSGSGSSSSRSTTTTTSGNIAGSGGSSSGSSSTVSNNSRKRKATAAAAVPEPEPEPAVAEPPSKTSKKPEVGGRRQQRPARRQVVVKKSSGDKEESEVATTSTSTSTSTSSGTTSESRVLRRSARNRL